MLMPFPGIDGHESKYPASFLTKYEDERPKRHPEGVDKHFWGSEIATEPPTVSHSEVMLNDDGIQKLTSAIVGSP
jgi:hypothetical protein